MLPFPARSSSGTASGASAPAATLARVRAWVRWHRHGVAAALAVLGVLLLARELRPPPAPVVEVVAAVRDLTSGTSIETSDVRLVHVPARSVPDGALRAPPVGRVVTLPVRRGEVLTDVRVLGDGLLDAWGPDTGMVAAPVHLADAATAALLRVGDVVDVLGAGPSGSASVSARRAHVLVVPAPRTGSAFGGGAPAGSDGVVVLAVTDAEAVRLARAAALDRLSVVIRGNG